MHEETIEPTKEEHKQVRKDLYIAFEGEETRMKRGFYSFLYAIKWLVLLSVSVALFMIVPSVVLFFMKHSGHPVIEIVFSTIVVIIFQILLIAAWYERPWKKRRR